MTELVKKFDTEYECKQYIEQHQLEAIAMPQYSECDGELLYYYIYYV